MAFVEYQDVRYAAQAMATLQGSFLLSSDRGAIRIEYAKSKMAEVGFTNLWIEVGFTLCYDRPLQKTRGRLYARDGFIAFSLFSLFFFVFQQQFVLSIPSLGQGRDSPSSITSRRVRRIFARAHFSHTSRMSRASEENVRCKVKRGACTLELFEHPELSVACPSSQA